VLIPQYLKSAASIEKDLVTIGMLDRVEIWAKERYDSDENGGLLSAEDLAEISDKYQV
jgi:MraZ protein